MSLSVYGTTGYIGTKYCNDIKRQKLEKVKKGNYKASYEEILYFISTNSNYNIFSDPHVDINTNLNYLVSVLESNKEKCKTFNFISSWFVYGDTDLPAKTNSPCRPTGFYSITKKCAEDLLISYCKTFKIDYRIIRLCNVYGGIDKNSSRKKNALHFMVEELINNNDVKLYSGGEVIRDYMHISDVVSAIDLIIEKGDKNKIYNVGSGVPSKIGDIIAQAKDFIGSKSKVYPVEIPEFHKIVQVKDMYLDVTDLEKLGFKRKVSIEEGVKKLCKELKKNL